MKFMYKIELSTDSDCHTVKHGEEYVSDCELYETSYFTKTTKNKVLNKLIKELKETEYTPDTQSGFIIDGVFTPTKLNVPAMMYNLRDKLISHLEEIKKTSVEDLEHRNFYYGGNQYCKLEIQRID